jgi:hypothetical protein
MLAFFTSRYFVLGRWISDRSHDDYVKIRNFPPLQELIDETFGRFKDRPLTPEEKATFNLE